MNRTTRRLGVTGWGRWRSRGGDGGLLGRREIKRRLGRQAGSGGRTKGSSPNREGMTKDRQTPGAEGKEEQKNGLARRIVLLGSFLRQVTTEAKVVAPSDTPRQAKRKSPAPGKGLSPFKVVTPACHTFTG